MTTSNNTSISTSNNDSISLQLNVSTQEGAAIFKLLAEMRTPASAELQAAAPSADLNHPPKPAPQTTTNGNYSDAVRQLHRELVSAASNGAPGQFNLLKFWTERGGQAPMKELVEHCGAKDFHALAGFTGSITKKLARLGLTTTVARRRPAMPKAWHGYVADLPKEEGTYTYYLAQELIQPLRQAFGLE